jgi:23S rRNA pseudouridine955/2504/2580 synthase/23S rRNA pseudouridine1911/1915/1917 synthase
MAAGGVGKRYVALVEGRFPGRPRNAAGAIAPDGSSIIRKKMRFFPNESPEAPPAGAKACQTRVERLTCGPALSLVSAAPANGRHHQVRATLLALGHPVVGDKIYGVDETLFVSFIEGRLTEEDWHRLRMSRQALHCAALAFDHPRIRRRRCIEAQVPPIFEQCLNEAT